MTLKVEMLDKSGIISREAANLGTASENDLKARLHCICFHVSDFKICKP